MLLAPITIQPWDIPLGTEVYRNVIIRHVGCPTKVYPQSKAYISIITKAITIE